MFDFTQQIQNMCITFVQRRPNVFDVGPTLYKCYTNVLCLYKPNDYCKNAAIGTRTIFFSFSDISHNTLTYNFSI